MSRRSSFSHGLGPNFLRNLPFGYSVPNLPQPQGNGASPPTQPSLPQQPQPQRPPHPPYSFGDWSFLSVQHPPSFPVFPLVELEDADNNDNDNDNSDEDYHYIHDDDDHDNDDNRVSEFSRNHSTSATAGSAATATTTSERPRPTSANQEASSLRPHTYMSPPNHRKRPASSGSTDEPQSSSRPTKRTRRLGPDSTQTNSVPHIDLSGDAPGEDIDHPIQTTLQRQREEQVRAQQPAPPLGKSKLTTIQCTVCLEPPTDLTATSCGHVFCRTCLHDWLSSTERESSRRPNCPACRKPLKNFRGPKQKDLVNLVFMKAPG